MTKQEMDLHIKNIAKTYGYEAQSRQCIEEMAELTQAINKLWRKCGNGQPYNKDIEMCKNNLIEELADVQIMIWQMVYLLKADVTPIIENKINRTLERIQEEKSEV